MTAEVDRVLDELYGVPPREFAAARNAKAAALKAAGHVEAAETVRRLGKPSPFLWAANQLGRRDPQRVAHFVDVVRRVRESQLRDPRTATDGMRAIRGELQILTKGAAEALTAAGYRVSTAATTRISNTLLGAAVDRDLMDALRRGRLTAELDAPGFEVLAGAGAGRQLRLVRGGQSTAPRRDADDSRGERTDARTDEAHATRARGEGLRAQAAAQRVREQAERERRQLEAAALRREAEERRAAADRAAQEVRELERRLADARRALRAAEREAAAAERARRHTDRRA